MLSATAFVLPLAGIALGWWSFRWSEEGVAPEICGDDTSTPSRSDELQLQRGQRFRARWCARICFNAGALLLAASVPLGSAANDGRFNVSALAAFLIIAFAAVYAAWEVWKIWQNRRADAFNIYFSAMMTRLYDREKTKEIYFRLNPMPPWTLPDRNWFENRNRPDVREFPEINETREDAAESPSQG